MLNQIKILFIFIFLIINYSCFAQAGNLKSFESLNKWGVINSNRTIVIPCIFDDLYVINHKITIGAKEDSIFVYNEDLKLLTKEKGFFFGGCIYEFYVNNDYIVQFGKVTNELVYISFRKSEDEIKYLYISNGKILKSEYTFENFRDQNNKIIYNSYFKIIEDNQRGIADIFGNIIIEPQYQKVELINNELILASKNGEFGIIDLLNREIIPFKFRDFITHWDINGKEFTLQKVIFKTLDFQIIKKYSFKESQLCEFKPKYKLSSLEQETEYLFYR